MAKEDFLFLENPMPGQVLRRFASEEEKAKVTKKAKVKKEANGEKYYSSIGIENPTTNLSEADIITSQVENSDNHKVILDIDFGAQLIPSSTPGHFHLYLDKEVSWDKYIKLLKALAAAGIIETGYAGASINRGYSAVRLPWVEKPVKVAQNDDDLFSEPASVPFGVKIDWKTLTKKAKA